MGLLFDLLLNFSAAAGAGLNGDRSNALWPSLELIDALRADGRLLPMIVLENVVGLTSPRSAGFFGAICGRLAGMGYRFGALEINAAAFLPQSRERVFIVAGTGVAGPRWRHCGRARQAIPHVAARRRHVPSELPRRSVGV